MAICSVTGDENAASVHPSSDLRQLGAGVVAPVFQELAAGNALLGPASPSPRSGPVIVHRRATQRGQIMVATQRIQVGMIHARKIVTAADQSCRLEIDGQEASVVPRTTSREIHRYKAYATQRRSHHANRDA